MNADPVETAWKVHASLLDWTGKADSKAAFALTVESGILVAITALSGNGRRLGKLSEGAPVSLLYTGVSLLALAILFAAAAVLPNVRKGAVSNEAADNFIFFGHLKSWEWRDLEKALRERDPLPVISRQLVVMSRIAWRKHACVKASLFLSVLGSALVALGGLLG